VSVGFANPVTPSLADFLVFLSTSVQIPASALPSGSPWPGYAFDQAKALVPCYPGVPGITFSLATYNCATALLFEIAPDVTGQTYFATKRGNTAEGFNLNAPSTGLVVSASDESTSTTLTGTTWAANMTVDDLRFFKTLWGQNYLAYLQKFGPTLWGLS
jgi:hypothetical protein